MTAVTLDLGVLDAAIARVLRALGPLSESAFPDLLDSIYDEIENVALPLLDQLSAAVTNAEDSIALRNRALALRGLVQLRAVVTHSAQSTAERPWTHQNSLDRRLSVYRARTTVDLPVGSQSYSLRCLRTWRVCAALLARHGGLRSDNRSEGGHHRRLQ